MTLFVWVDENGEWRATHRPPVDDSAFLRVVVGEGQFPLFFNEELEELDIEV